jgi:hypothetical protein
MRPVPSISLALLCSLSITGCAEEALWAVRATMDDGQVLMGGVSTPELLLEGGMGTIAIPWDDVGEVVPVEGNELLGSGGYVNVWLRNGSELTGRWADAELGMDVSVGGELLAIDVPVEPLLRLQTQGGEVWPQGVVYRVRTSHGDDFLVNPEASHLVIENDMGTFAPFLSECVSATPLDDAEGDWRIELVTGTVLIGPVADSAITFDLDLGPSQVTVPLETLVSLERQDWGGYIAQDGDRLSDRIMRALPGPAKREQAPTAAPVQAWEPEAMAADPMDVDGRFRDTGGSGAALAGEAAGFDRSGAAAVGGQRSTDGWFSNGSLQQVKQAMH